MLKKMKNNSLFIVLFISVLFSSMLGAKIMGISLNKIALLPLIIYLLFSKFQTFKINKYCTPLLIFFLIQLLSSSHSLLLTYAKNFDGFINTSILNIISDLFIYFPLIILINGYSNRSALKNKFIHALVITCRIHLIWSVCQFVIYSIFKYSINDLTQFLFTRNSTAFTNLGPLGVFIRPTGLTTDPAFFGITMVLGFILDKKSANKLLYFLMSILSMSRVSIIVIIIAFILNFLLKNKVQINAKKIFVIITVLFVLFIICMTSKTISSQISALLYRFNIIKDVNAGRIDGTSRHILYIPMSFKALLKQNSIITFLIGCGPRQSGPALVVSNVMNEYLSEGMFINTWSIECDIAELILGYGVLGFISYYLILSILILKEKRIESILFISIAIFGIMYNVSSATLIVLTIIVFYLTTNYNKSSNIEVN